MTTALTKTNAATGLTQYASGAAALVQAATSAGVAGSVGKRLSHSGKTGEWRLNTEAVDCGSEFFFDMLGARIQWLAWKDNKPIANHTEKLIGGAPLPAETDLEDHWGGRRKGSDGWQKNLIFDLVDPNTGEQYEVSLKADHERRPAPRLITEYANKSKVNKDGEGNEMWPVVEIGNSPFFSKQANDTLHSPTLKIVDWVTIAEVDALRDAVKEAASGMGAYEDTKAEAKEPEPAPEPEQEVAPRPARRTGRRV